MRISNLSVSAAGLNGVLEMQADSVSSTTEESQINGFIDSITSFFDLHAEIAPVSLRPTTLSLPGGNQGLLQAESTSVLVA